MTMRCCGETVAEDRCGRYDDEDNHEEKEQKIISSSANGRVMHKNEAKGRRTP